MTSLAHPADGVYLSQLVLQLSEPPEPQRWWRAWQQVCDRHEALRCAFLVTGRPTPVCVVLRDVALDGQQVDGIEDLDQWLLQDRSQPFASESPPLHRHRLLTGIAGDASRCAHVWTFHHAICDGWSTQVVLDEVFQIYRRTGQGDVANLAPPPSLRRWFESVHVSQASADALEQLREQQVAMVAPTPLPGAIAQRSALEPATLNSCDAALSAQQWQQLKTSAQGLNVSPASVVSAAWAVVLGGLGRVTQVSFGVSFAAREHGPSNGLVGMIMHTLPLTVSVERQTSVASLVQGLNKRVHRMAEAGPASWQQLQKLRRDALGDEADDLPFHSLVSFENVYEAADAAVDTVAVDTGASIRAQSIRYIDQSNLPFSLTIIPGQQLRIRAYYHDGAVPATLAQRLLEFLVQALCNFASVTQMTVGDWHYLGEAERQQVAFDFARANSLERADSVVDRLERNATQFADRIAIRQGDRALNYRSLWQQAGAVQQALADQAVDFVVLIASLQPQLISAMFGVMLSGRPYVPMDVEWPPERVRQLLRRLSESGSVAVVTDNVSVVKRALDSDVRVFDLATIVDCEEHQPADRVHSTTRFKAANEDTAYVMFTSGSSGEPKAVSVSHAALAASTASRDQVYSLPPQRFLLLSSVAFDSSVVGIYWTLCSGTELILPEAPLSASLENLGQIVCHHRITHTLCLPSVHALLLSMLSARNDHELTNVIVAGEECPMSVVQQHARVLPEVELWNEYGPTESTVWCCGARLLAPSEPGLPFSVSIGQPVPGTIIRLLDYQDRPVPIGFAGELLVGGRLLADGYLGDSARTDQQFVLDPLGSGVRLYRTGDLARWDDAGSLHYLGRLDQQVKIRGVRVEPADAEAVIAQLAGVAEVCVLQVSVPDERGPALLAAALVARSPSAPEQDWAAIVAERLPAAMVPRHFVRYRQLPRLSNGKLDRQRLKRDLQRDIGSRVDAHLDSADNDADADALNDIQTRILRQINAVLPDLKVDRRRSLFDAGLDSLSAVRLLLAVNQELGSQLSVADIYAHPSVAGLAAASRIADDGQWLRSVAMSPQPSKYPLFFAYGNGQRIAEMAPRATGVHWLIHGRGETVMPIDSFDVLARRHIEQIREVQPHGPYRLGGFSLGALLVIEIARQLIDAGERVQWLGLVDPTSPDHFAIRGRHVRLRAMLRSQSGLGKKAIYLWQFLKRLPEFVRDRGQRNEISGTDLIMPASAQADTDSTAPAAGIDHGAIIDQVKQVLRQFDYSPIACPLALFRLRPSTTQSLEWHDEAVFWALLGQGRLDEADVVADGSHRDFFKDAAVEAAFRHWLQQQLVRTES